MDNIALSLPRAGMEIELIERMSSIAEELEDLVEISKGKEFKEKIALKDPSGALLKEAPQKFHLPLYGAFKTMIVKNLARGRLLSTVYYSGKEAGLRAQAKTKEEAASFVAKLGIGSMKFSKFENEDVEIHLHGSFSSEGVKHVARPVCFFEAGVFAGLLEGVLRRKVHVIESHCAATGHGAHCTFKIGGEEKDGAPYSLDFSHENLKLLTSLAAHSITAIENALLFEKTKREVIVDSLTQVYNHRFFQTSLNVECRRAQRYHAPLTLVMVDVDNFKKFNDKFGHPQGDEILKFVAATLKQSVRDVDIVARYGGDEFALILPQTDEKGAEVVTGRIRKKISEKKIKAVHSAVTVSIGAVTLRETVKNAKPSSVIEVADKALLTAKRKGKNKTIFAKNK